MALDFWRDDNNMCVDMVDGLRRQGGSANMVTIITGAAVAETTLPGGRPQSAHGGRRSLLRISPLVVTIGAFYSLGVAGQSGSFTGITNMQHLPIGRTEIITVDATDTTIYMLQDTGANLYVVSWLH